MQVIYKYEIRLESRQSLLLPVGARILSFQIQDNRLFIWALAGDFQHVEMRNFQIFGTGYAIEDIDHLKYIGSIQLEFVWHLFEEI